MRLSSQSWLNLSIGLLLGLVVVNGGIAYHNLQQLHQDAAHVAQTHVVIESLRSAVSTLVDAETGERGFLVTDDPAYLQPYNAAVARSGEVMQDLASSAATAPSLKERLPQLKLLVDRRLSILASAVEAQRAGGREPARKIVQEGEGKRTMDRIREIVGGIEQQQRLALADRERADDRAYRTAVAGVIISSLAGIGALTGLLVLLRRHLLAINQFAADLFQQRELLQATLISIGDGVIMTDIQGRVTFLNSVAEKLTGWSLAEAVGQDLVKIFNIVNETTRELVDNPSLRALREGKIVGLANHTILISKDGTEWPIDDSAAPIKTEQGQVSGSVLVFREISQRKAQQASLIQQTAALQSVNARMTELVGELKSSEELFHSMADSIPQLAWMTRADGHIYWYNRRWYEYTGASPEEMEGWGWQKVQDPAELPRVLEKWKAALEAGDPWEDTFPLRRADGEMRWHLSRAEPLRNEQGEIVRWFGTNTDITERLAMEQALREADRRKDEFLATLAHELRNPIAPISNALQVWPLVENDREEVEKLRAIMDRQIRQMTRLIDDLLDVSRITRGKIQLRRQPVDLGTIISGAVEAIRPLIDAHEHHLEIVTPAEPVMVDGDVARLTQAIGNLLQNAAKYTPHGGQLRLAVEREGNQAVVRVTDNGVGIPPEMLQQIFEMFQQVDQTLDRSHGGLGLGLTLVKRLVELHGGSVEATSPGEGQGSEFVLRLPLLATAESTAPLSPAPFKRGNGLPRHRVLVVDDVYASAKTLAMMLESINQEVAIAHDGPAAIEHVLSQRPDIVFLDIAMPGMSGYEVAQHLRQQPQVDGIRLVALTGYGHEEDRRQAIEAGFHHHLTKPASIDQLAQLLHALPGGL